MPAGRAERNTIMDDENLEDQNQKKGLLLRVPNRRLVFFLGIVASDQDDVLNDVLATYFNGLKRP